MISIILQNPSWQTQHRPKPRRPRLNRRGGGPVAVLHWPVDAVTSAYPPTPHSQHPQHTGASGGASHSIWSCWPWEKLHCVLPRLLH